MTPAETVTPIRSAPPLKPRAQALLDRVAHAGGIVPVLGQSYLVKGWLQRATISVVYGPSNVGKSFLAVDIAHHVSKGRAWAGRRVNRSRVLYIAAEGGGTFGNRVAGLDDPEFWVLSVPVTLIGKASDAAALVQMVRHLTDVGGAPFGLIVVDTMARVMGGGDENTAPDIADLVENLDLMRRETGAHVMVIHHSGKDLTRGARGHSSLRAAIDTEIVLARDKAAGLITATVDKQRDGPTGLKFHYKLRQVELGLDPDGDPVTTCVVELGDPDDCEQVTTGPAQTALDVLSDMIARTGAVQPGPTHPGGKAVTLDDWRAACGAAPLTRSREKDSIRKAFNRARKDLEAKRLIVVRDDFVWRVE